MADVHIGRLILPVADVDIHHPHILFSSFSLHSPSCTADVHIGRSILPAADVDIRHPHIIALFVSQGLGAACGGVTLRSIILATEQSYPSLYLQNHHTTHHPANRHAQTPPYRHRARQAHAPVRRMPSRSQNRHQPRLWMPRR